MTKQEKIKEAYGKWHNSNIDENGWTEISNIRNIGDDILLDVKTEFPDGIPHDYARPTSLRGIENKPFNTIAIKVMLESNNNTLFVIEGFDKKEVTEEILHNFTKKHFEHLYAKDVEIIPKDKDFIVKVSDSEYRLTWSWVMSYKLENLKF